MATSTLARPAIDIGIPEKGHRKIAEGALAPARRLVRGHEAVARTARKIFPVVDKSSDEPTADLLTQRMQVHEKTAWMLRSLLEA